MTRKPSPTRAPKPAPFTVGSRVRYVGKRGDSYAPAVPRPRDFAQHPEDWIRIFGRGIEVTIDQVRPGRRGTGHQLRDEDGPMFYDDGGEPIPDETRDGYSVYHVAATGGSKHGRAIHYKDRAEWEVVHSATERCSAHPEDATASHEAIEDEDGPRCAYCGVAVAIPGVAGAGQGEGSC